MAAGRPKKKQLDELCMSSRDVHAELRARYKLDSNEWAAREIRDAFKRGLHADVSSQVMSRLEVEFRTQSRIADFLGVDRTSVSKMKSNQSVGAVHLEMVIASIGFRMDRERATRRGLIEACFCVRRSIQGDGTCNDRMSDAEYSELQCGVQSEWYEAFVLALLEVEDLIGGCRKDVEYR